ncbi:MAG: Na/Pi cotransporter family protein [Oscillospiraceae bacterium]|nr:Na/Pi cotransporter family protein [Oscillospiraceae bacterium]
MSVFDIFMLLGGVALFLFGMNTMTTGLEKTAGGKLESILKKATSSKAKAFVLGAGITAAIQSSSAVVVMLVGLVNSGIMSLHQTVGVIMGMNIGTTVTAWILSLTGLTGDSFIILLLKPENFSQVFAVVGIALIMFSKRTRRKSKGEILIGFAVLISGLTVMRGSVTGLESNEQFQSVLTAFSNPLLGVLVSALFTAVIQSSSASIGILQMLSLTVGLPYATAIPIIMGQNIGTCATAVLSSIGANRDAKRVAGIHIYFNAIGSVIFLVVLYTVNAFVHFPFMSENVNPISIAAIHTIFNLSATALLLPFSRLLEKLAELTIKDAPGERTRFAYIDERILTTPSIAIAQCRNMVSDMGKVAKDAVLLSMEIVKKYDEKTAAKVREYEENLDIYEDNLNSFLLKLSSRSLTSFDGWQVNHLLHIIGDLERIGDHAVNIVEASEEMEFKELAFSEKALQDLDVAHGALTEILSMTFDALESGNRELAARVDPLEEVIDYLVSKMRTRHIERLQLGECSVVQGFIWSNLLISYERISDHCLNMALSIVQSESRSVDRHSYLSETRMQENEAFQSAYNAYMEKYSFL